MHATVLLANSALGDSTGVVHALGLGWSHTGTPLGQSAVVVFLELEPHEQHSAHQLRLELVDEDGNPITFGTNGVDGDPAPLTIEGKIDGLVRPGETACTSTSHAIAFTIAAGMPLSAGTRYEWRLDIDQSFLARRSFAVVDS
ncbi:hypothetical protein GCM10011519_05490 [Marmoricola endophyticus]|uniref:Uncharacterized protein n=2 Tax=Marmoricola endophyticus TaxID=2040280 RepID=A0A917EZE5_9ACTN|nr:hypothetical protein GCM10011519_05490 [Marmoricola endophyticus]